MRDAAEQSTYLTLPEQANFLAARTVAHATAYLDGRNDAAELGRHTDAMQCEIMTAWSGTVDTNINAILDPVRLLVFAMHRASLAQGEVRQARWHQVMDALVKLVRNEAGELRKAPEQASRTAQTKAGAQRS